MLKEPLRWILTNSRHATAGGGVLLGRGWKCKQFVTFGKPIPRNTNLRRRQAKAVGRHKSCGSSPGAWPGLCSLISSSCSAWVNLHLKTIKLTLLPRAPIRKPVDQQVSNSASLFFILYGFTPLPTPLSPMFSLFLNIWLYFLVLC